MPTRMEKRKAHNSHKRSEYRAFFVELAIALLLSVLIRNYVFSFTTVDGPSMQDTLFTAQVMAVDKLFYTFSPIVRGQIVICKYPQSDDFFIKRVVGLPGETLRIQKGTVYIDDIPLLEPYVTHPDTQSMPPIRIEKTHYFVMGDNRANSHDSRSEGTLPKRSITGHVLFVVYPFDKMRSLTVSK